MTVMRPCRLVIHKAWPLMLQPNVSIPSLLSDIEAQFWSIVTSKSDLATFQRKYWRGLGFTPPPPSPPPQQMVEGGSAGEYPHAGWVHFMYVCALLLIQP